MTITYRTAGAWGAGKGSNLTPAEVDGNFYDLVLQIAAIISGVPAPVNISNIVVVGTQMTIVLEDATEFGPFTLPQANFRPSVVATVSTTTYDPVLADGNGYKRLTNVAGCAVTIPSDAEVNFPVDTEITFDADTIGAVTFDAATDVVLKPPSGFLNQMRGDGAVVTWKKLAANTWRGIGMFAEDVTA